MKRNNRIKYVLFILIFLLSTQWTLTTVAEGRTDMGREKTFIRRQRRALKKAEELFLKGDYRGVVKTCEDILYLSKRYTSKKRYLDELYYLTGTSYLKLNDSAKAKLYLNIIISRYKSSSLLDDAYLVLAEVCFLDEDYGEAAELLIHYVKRYPKGSFIPRVYLRLGQIAQKEGRWQEAKFYFDKVENDFPLSFEARLIPSLSSEENFFFTVQSGSFNNLGNARELKKKLEGRGYFPYIVEVRSSKTTFYRVRVGRFKSKAEARYLANELKKQGFETKIYP